MEEFILSDIVFSNKVKDIKPSPIREVAIKGASVPNFISLALGSPAPESFPEEELKQTVLEILNEDSSRIFQYGNTNGVKDLIDIIKVRMNKYHNVDFNQNDVLIVTGSQQGLDIAPRVFCNEGEGVFCDQFTFTGALCAMKTSGVTGIGVEADQFGMIPESLLEKIENNPNGKYIYLIPNFHNPTGITIPIERRQVIYEIALKHNLIIYEDDPYGDINFEKKVDSFKSMDNHNIVVYAGSFSKTLAAGLRVGFICAEKAIIEKFAPVKGFTDSQTPAITQLMISNYIKKYDYEKHLEFVRNIYKAKCETMISALDLYMHKSVKKTYPKGGMFVWITMPEYVDCRAFAEEAIQNGVGIVHSSAFSTDEENEGNSFRLNYSSNSKENIEKSIRKLGELSYKYCQD